MSEDHNLELGRKTLDEIKAMLAEKIRAESMQRLKKEINHEGRDCGEEWWESTAPAIASNLPAAVTKRTYKPTGNADADYFSEQVIERRKGEGTERKRIEWRKRQKALKYRYF